MRPDEGFFFANADALRNDILKHVENSQTPVRVVLLDLEMSNQLDVPSVDTLAELKKELEQRSVELWLSRLHGPVRDALARSEVLQQIAQKDIYSRTLESSLEYLSRAPSEGQEDMAVIRDGLKMTLEVIDRLLNHPTGAQREELLEWYRRKLTEILRADHAQSSENSIKVEEQ
jgi:MFS superfamily sulfate permease-like transporter